MFTENQQDQICDTTFDEELVELDQKADETDYYLQFDPPTVR